MCATIENVEHLKGWRAVMRYKQFKKQKGLLNLSYYTKWNLKHKCEHKQKD